MIGKTKKIIKKLEGNFKDLNRIRKYIKAPLRLEIHAADHCNLNCANCSHFSPISEPSFCNPDKLAESLVVLGKYERLFDRVKILGGEPLLNPQLPEIIELTRKNFPHIDIKIATNGILLLNENKVPINFWETLRKNNVTLMITQYPVNVDFQEIERKCIEEGIKVSIKDAKIWRKTLLKDTHEELSFKSRLLKVKYCLIKYCIQLYDGRLYPCNYVAYINKLNNYFGTSFKLDSKDYLEVNKIKSAWQIRKFMLLATPFCKYCMGHKQPGEWQHSCKDLKEWVQ